MQSTYFHETPCITRVKVTRSISHTIYTITLYYKNYIQKWGNSYSKSSMTADLDNLVTMWLGFWIHSFAMRTTVHLTCTISLPVCKYYSIHCTTFILALNDAENSRYPENIIVVSFVRVSFTSISRYRQLADTGRPPNCNGQYTHANHKQFVLYMW